LCLEGIERMRNALAAGITNLANIFDPEAIVVGGEIEFAEKLLHDHLVNAIRIKNQFSFIFLRWDRMCRLLAHFRWCYENFSRIRVCCGSEEYKSVDD